MSGLNQTANGKKLAAVFTLACFFLSSVAGQVLAVAVDEMRQETYRKALTQKEALIPSSAGRITDAGYFGGDKVVVVIQDLHCHPEVQRNISAILTSLDKSCEIKNIYLEGSSGGVDTSWLNAAIKNKVFRDKVIETLLRNGELTGPEYFSYVSGKHGIIRGLENEALYNETISRLAKIHQYSGRSGKEMAAAEKELRRLQSVYLGRGNQRLERLSRQHSRGKIEARKYYTVLFKQARASGIETGVFGNIAGFLALHGAAKQLNYRKISQELNECIAFLKRRLPFNAYNELASLTGGWQYPEALIALLPLIAREHNFDLRARFLHLETLLSYNRLSDAINPVALLKEERKLLWTIQYESSRNESEKDVVFIGNVFKAYRDFLSGSISASDYRDLESDYARFAHLWNLYSEEKFLSSLGKYRELLREYYQGNIRRNEWFVKNSTEEGGRSASLPVLDRSSRRAKDSSFSSVKTLRALSSSKGAVVAVTGGFHTPGYTGLLEKKGISYIVITPNVTQNTGFADVVYHRRVKEQAGMHPERGVAVSAAPGNPITNECANVRPRSAGTDLEKMRVVLWAAQEVMSAEHMPYARIAQEINAEILEGTGYRIVINDKTFTITDSGGYVVGEYDLETGAVTALDDGLGGKKEYTPGTAAEADPLLIALNTLFAEALARFIESLPEYDELVEGVEDSFVALGVRSNEVVRRLLASRKMHENVLGMFLVKPSTNLAKILLKKNEGEEQILTEYGDNSVVFRVLQKAYEMAVARREAEDPDLKLPRAARIFCVQDQYMFGEDRCILGRLAFEKDEESKDKKQVIISLASTFGRYIEAAASIEGPLESFLSLEDMLVTFMEHELDEYLALNDPASGIGMDFTEELVVQVGISAAKARTRAQRTSQRFHTWIKERCPSYLLRQKALLDFADTWVTTINGEELEPLSGVLRSLPRQVRFIFADMDGTLVQEGDTEISRYMVKEIRRCLERKIGIGIVSSSSFEDVRRKVLERFIWELRGRGVDQKIFVERNNSTQARERYEKAYAEMVAGFGEWEHHLLERLPVAANNGGQIWQWDRKNCRYYCSYADKMPQRVLDAILGDKKTQGILHGLIYNSPFGEKIIKDYEKFREEPVDEKQMIRTVGILGDINEVDVFLLGRYVTAGQKKKYAAQEEDWREKIVAYLKAEFESRGLMVNPIKSGQSRIIIVSNNTRKSNAIVRLKRELSLTGLDPRDHSLYLGNKFKWVVRNGTPVSDGRDSSPVEDRTVAVAVDVGEEQSIPEGVDIKAPLVHISNGPVGTAACLDMVRSKEYRKDEDVLSEAARAAAETARPRKALQGIASAAIASSLSQRQEQWLHEQFPWMTGKTFFHFFESGVSEDALSRIIEMERYGRNIVFLGKIPPGKRILKAFKGKVSVRRDGRDVIVPVTYGSMKDEAGNSVAVVCAKDMRPEDVFAVAHFMTNQPPEIKKEFKRSLGLPAESLKPDIVDLRCSQMPDILNDHDAFPGREIAVDAGIVVRIALGPGQQATVERPAQSPFTMRVMVMAAGDQQEELPARTAISEIYAPLLQSGKGGIMAPGAELALITPVSAIPFDNSGIGGIAALPRFLDRPEYRRIPVILLLPFFISGAKNVTGLDYLYPLAADPVLLSIGKVPGINSHTVSPAATSDDGAIDREAVIRNNITAMSQSLKNMPVDSKAWKAFSAFQKDHAERLLRHWKIMSGQFGYPREYKVLFDLMQYYLSMQIRECVKTLHSKGREAHFRLEFDGRETAEDNIEAIGLWLEDGFDGVVVRIRQWDLIADGILERIKKEADAHSNGRNKSVTVILPKDSSLHEIRGIKEKYGFKVGRSYSEIAQEGMLDSYDVIMPDSLETPPDEDTYCTMAGKSRGAGMFCLALWGSDPLALMPQDYEPWSLHFIEKLSEGFKRVVRQDPETHYWAEYEMALDSIEALPKRPHGFSDTAERGAAKLAYESLLAVLEGYEDNPTALADLSREMVARLDQNGYIPHPLLQSIEERTDAYLRSYGIASNREEKLRLNAAYAGFVRGVITGLALHHQRHARKTEKMSRPLQALYALEFVYGLNADGAMTFKEFSRIMPAEAPETADTDGFFLSIVSVLKRIHDLESGADPRDASKSWEQVRSEILGLIQPFLFEIERKGILPASFEKAFGKMEGGAAPHRTIDRAKRYVTGEIIRIYEKALQEDGSSFTGKIEPVNQELRDMYHAILEAA